ncbi:MAG: hypothetical protein II888_04485 [Clostridia bacterium]|nr:hypothetical protein [Clostridia bacterium]
MPQRDLRSGIRSSLGKRDIDGKRPGNRTSQTYNRFFEGYTEVRQQKDHGTSIQRVYTGTWYEQDLKLFRQILLRLLYLGLWLGSAALLAVGSLMPLPCNRCWYTVAAQAIAIAGFLWMASPMISYLTLYGRMTIGAYKRSAMQLAARSIWASAGMLLTLLVSFIAMLMTGEGLGGEEAMLLLMDLLASALLFIIQWRERNVPWRLTASSAEASRSLEGEEPLTIEVDAEDIEGEESHEN